MVCHTFGISKGFNGVSLMGQTVKNLPALQETWVQSLGQEDPLEKGMTSTPLFLPEEFHGQRTWEATVHTQGHKESDTTERLTLSLSKV